MRPTSTSIGYKAAQTLYYAIGEQAERIGLPLNTWVTINFSLTAIDPWDSVQAFKDWRYNYFNKWARRPRKGQGQSFAPTIAYVFENKRGNDVYDEIGPDLPHNVQVHALFHIPPERQHDFECRAFEWLDAVTGGISAANAIDIRVVTQDNGIKNYCLKGSQPRVAKHFGVKNYSPQGAIKGKRTGTTANLGPSARKALDKALSVDRKENRRNFYRAA